MVLYGRSLRLSDRQASIFRTETSLCAQLSQKISLIFAKCRENHRAGKRPSVNRQIKTAVRSALRANESALKMPADRRDSKTRFQMKPGEWAFSMERLTGSFRFRSQGSFPKNGFQRCPLEGLCFLSSFHESKCPPRHEGQALRQQKPHAGAPAGKLCPHAHRGKPAEKFTLSMQRPKRKQLPARPKN